MFLILRSFMVMTTASIGAGLLAAPVAAYAADTTTKLSAASMAAELKAVSTTSTAAAKNGWKATMSLTSSDVSGTALYIVDPAAGIATEQIRIHRAMLLHATITAGTAAVRQNQWMSYMPRVIIAAVLAGAGMTGIGWFLLSEGLDRAEKWVSIVVGVTSLVLAAAGLWLGLLTWRRTRNPVAPDGGPGSSGKYHVHAPGAKGLAIGDHITQHNSFNAPEHRAP